jgi:Trk-type K+ transport system membrane component
MTNKAKQVAGGVAVIAICLAGGIAWGILQDPDPTQLKDVNFWLIMLGVFGGMGLIFLGVYYLLRSLRWLGSKIATLAEASLPIPIFNACRWVVRGIAASWHVLIFLFLAASLGRVLFG